ncbi:DUF2070 family protein [Tardisphaera miroshnichenkoae]
MDPQKSANELEKRKKWLFHVPIPDWLIFPVSFLELLALFLRPYPPILAALLAAASVIVVGLLATYLQPKKLFNFRQSLLMGDFFYSIPLIFEYSPFRGIDIIPIGVSFTAYPMALAYVATAGNPLFYLPIVLVFFFPVLAISGLHEIPYLAVIYAGSIGLAYLTIHKIDNKTLSIIGLKGSSFGASFFRAWFNKNDQEYEEYLESLSSKSPVKSDVFYFVDRKGSPIGSIVVTDAHPGPFHEVGSSTLPSMMSEGVEKATGAPCMVLRGKGSHENDIPTRKLAKSYSETISSSMFVPLKLPATDPPSGWAACTAIDFDQVKAGPFTLTSIKSDKENLVLLSKAPYPCDDIPREIGEGFEAAGCKVADAHNSGPIDGYSTLNYFPPSNVDQIATGIQKLVTSPVERSDFQVGFSHLETEKSLKTGICDGGVVAMTWKKMTKNGVLVSFQGNNMVLGLRDKIVEALRGMGFKEAEVATTDNHQLSTSLQAVNKYSMVGAADEETVLNLALKAAKMALERQRDAMMLVQKRVDEIKVIGSEGLDKINQAMKASLPILGKYFITSLVLLVLASAFFCFL